MNDTLSELQALVARHARAGVGETALAGVHVSMDARPTGERHGLRGPGAGLVVQGAKRTVVGERVFEYGAGDFIVTSVDLPIATRVTRASEDQPYLACRLNLQPSSIAALLVDAADDGALATAPCGVGVHAAPSDLLDAFVRLLRLLDAPRDAPVLRPLVEREILWRLLCGPQGGRVRQIGLVDGRLARVGRAIRHIRERYADTLGVEELAGLAAMSVSSFHRHFRAVTALSPLQYQKQIRLHEARSRLLAAPGEVAAIGFAVGYDSSSQFSREYKRLFGEPPGRDGARLREVADPA